MKTSIRLLVLAAALVVAAELMRGSALALAATAIGPANAILMAGVLALALAAAALAVQARGKVRALEADLLRYARSLDAALKGPVGRDLAARAETAALAGPSEPIRLPALHAGFQTPDQAVADEALRAALAGGRLEASLQPIVDVGENVAVGFRAQAQIEREDGSAVTVSYSDRVTEAEAERFETMLLRAAAATARRHLGERARAMPIHVPLSGALLDRPEALAGAVALLKRHPSLPQSLVLSFRPGAVDGASRLGAIEKLAATGVGLEFDLDDAIRLGPLALGRLGAVCVSGEAEWLIERVADGLGAPIAGLLDGGLEVHAFDVETEAAALALVDLGVRRMSGALFSDTRLLPEPPDPDRSALVSLAADLG